MKVSELAEKLKQLPPDTEIRVLFMDILGDHALKIDSIILAGDFVDESDPPDSIFWVHRKIYFIVTE